MQNNTMQNNSSPPNYLSANQTYEYIQPNHHVSDMTSLFAAEIHSGVPCQTHTQNYAVENFSGPPRHQANDTYNHNLYPLTNVNMPLTTSLRPNEQNNYISHDYSYGLFNHQQQEISFNRPSSTQQGPSYYTQQLDTDSTNNMQHNTLSDGLMALIDDLNLDDYGIIIEPPIEENRQINPQLNSNMQPQFCNFGESEYPVAATSSLTAMLPTQQQALSNYSYITAQYSDTAITNGSTTTARKCERSSSTSSSLDDNCIKLPNGKFKCRLCDKEFCKLSYFKQHYKYYHNGMYPYRCEICGKRFQLEKVFTVHQSKHGSKDKKYKCDICPKQYHYKADLKRHANTEHCGRVFTCEICKKRYTRRDHLLKHQKTHNK